MCSTPHTHQYNSRGQQRYLVSESGCWVWLLSSSHGYPYLGLRVDGKRRRLRAHRWFYEQYKGLIPKGKIVHHLCENKLCVCPDHLELTDHKTHNRNHKLGKPLKISEEESLRRSEHGKKMIHKALQVQSKMDSDIISEMKSKAARVRWG